MIRPGTFSSVSRPSAPMFGQRTSTFTGTFRLLQFPNLRHWPRQCLASSDCWQRGDIERASTELVGDLLVGLVRGRETRAQLRIDAPVNEKHPFTTSDRFPLLEGEG